MDNAVGHKGYRRSHFVIGGMKGYALFITDGIPRQGKPDEPWDF